MCEHRNVKWHDEKVQAGYCRDCGLRVPDPFEVNPFAEWAAAFLVPFGLVIAVFSLFSRGL
jgi:hypothetical protein